VFGLISHKSVIMNDFTNTILICRCCCGLLVTSHSPSALSAFEDQIKKQQASLESLSAHGTSGRGPPLASLPGPLASSERLEDAAAAIAEAEHWNPGKHTVPNPTDAYGCIDFRGGTRTNKAQVSA